MNKIKILITRMSHALDLPLPQYMTNGSIGMDLRSVENVDIDPMQRLLIPTGLSIALPDGVEAQIRPRSGLALKYGITVLNTPGTIDSDYRGELQVLLINFGSFLYNIKRGDRIAQLIMAPCIKIQWQEVDLLPESDRNEHGFGSTGCV